MVVTNTDMSQNSEILARMRQAAYPVVYVNACTHGNERVAPRPTGFLPSTFRQEYIYGHFRVHGRTDGKCEAGERCRCLKMFQILNKFNYQL